MIPQILQEVAAYLSSADFDLVKGHDARADSNQAEFTIVQTLQKAKQWDVFSPNVKSGNNRSWYDVNINGYYIDIKISTCKTADNTNAKAAIYYLLTGILPDKVSPRNDTFFKSMRENETPNKDRDFYYLIINKDDPSDVFVTSLKGLTHVVPNANNPPFQSNWGRCRKTTKRSWKKARDFLLKCWIKSVEKNIINQREGILKVYPEFSDLEITENTDNTDNTST